MIGAINSSGRRKLCCPKCTARVHESTASVYRCPICSALLQGRGSPGDVDARILEKRLRENVRDADEASLHLLPPKERQDDFNERSLENGLHRNVRDVGSTQQTLLGDSKQEDSTVMNEPSEAQGKQGLDSVEKESASFAGYTGLLKPSIEAFAAKIDKTSSEPESRSSHSSDRSGVSSDGSSCDESEGDFDFPAVLSKDAGVVELPEIVPFVGLVEGSYLEQNGDQHVPPAMLDQKEGPDLEIDDGVVTRHEVLRQVVGCHVEHLSQEEEGPGEQRFDVAVERNLDCEMVHSNEGETSLRNASLKHSLIVQDLLETADYSDNDRLQSSLAESRIKNECFGDLRYQINDVHPSAVADNDRSERGLTESDVSTGSEDYSEVTKVQERYGNKMALEASELHDADFGHSVSSDVDRNGNDWNQASPVPASTLSHQVKDSNSEVDMRYADVWTKELISTEVLDLSLGDWQSLQIRKPHEDSKGMNVHRIDEKRSVNFETAGLVSSSSKDGEDVPSPTLQGDAKLKQSLLTEASAVQEEAFSGIRTAKSGNAILITENDPQIDRPAFPLRTAAMQKFLQTTQIEVESQMQVHHKTVESEASINERPYVGECQPCDPLSTVEHLKMGSSVSEQVDSTGAQLLPASKLEATNVEPVLSGQSEKVVAARHSHVMEAVHGRRFNVDQGQESDGGAFTEYQTFSDMSANGLGELPEKCFHHLDNRIIPRLQVYDHEGKLPDVSVCQPSENADVVDLYAAGLNRTSKGIPVEQRRFLTSNSVAHLDPVHGYRQDHYNVLQRQKFGRDRNVVNHCPGCGGATCMCSPYARRAHVHPIEPVREHASSHCIHHCVCSLCTFCIQHAHLQQPHVLPSMMYPDCTVNCPESTLVTHQPVLPECGVSFGAHHIRPSLHANTSAGPFQTGYYPSQSQASNRSDFPTNHRVRWIKKQKHYPSLPFGGSPPYVLCQCCHNVLQVPANIPCNSGNVQKLRCGACRKVSKFSVDWQANNSTLVKSSLVSSVDSARDMIARVTIGQHSVESSTAFKLHPEAAMVLPGEHSSSFLSSQSRDYLGNDALDGGMKFGSGLRTQHESGENQMSLQATGFARPKHTFQSMSLREIVQGQGLVGSQSRYGEDDVFLNSPGTNGDSYFSSSPSSTSGSSPQRNVSNHPRNKNRKVEMLMKEREIFGRREGSKGSTMNIQDEPASRALSGSHDYSQKDSNESRKIFSPASTQVSLQEHDNESSPVESLKRGQPREQQLMGSDDSRSSSTSSTPRVQKLPAVPGSPLFEHFAETSADFGSSLQQIRISLQGSENSVRSAPRSPAQGSPLSDHATSLDFDGEPLLKARGGSRVHEASAQDVSRGPRYFAGLLRKSLRDHSKGGQGNNNRQKVTINGQLMAEAALKKAEERAGIIRPGSYWYDYRAGFWGVLGGPCIGIIPPFIEELKFPLPKDCSGGTTGVTVNGRELHPKDLQVLSRRGLPTTPGKAYIIDITGQVVDKDSGQELKSLGKLAPTVEIKGCGNGMFQPNNMRS